jgi:hypothetical protein
MGTLRSGAAAPSPIWVHMYSDTTESYDAQCWNAFPNGPVSNRGFIR